MDAVQLLPRCNNMIDNAIIYEQPLNELIRVCLRLEQLFLQIDHLLPDTSAMGTRKLIVLISNLLQLLDRPDLKAKLAKELSHHYNMLNRLSNLPKIDQDKLQETLKQLDTLSRNFIDSNRKIGQNLREIELLNTLRLHFSTPGGGCSFDVPVFHFWLQQPHDRRQETIKTWISEFNQIRTATSLILQLIREGIKVHEKSAEHGFYQELLDPQLNLKLIRVAVPTSAPAYPEISVGRHFMSIRFFTPNIVERPTQYPDNLNFWLAYGSS